MDLSFLKTKQKNTNIPFSNFDFTHDNGYTSQLGQMLVTQCTKVLPNDKIKHRINEETLLQPLENPSFTKFKHVHKSFYYPNTVLWKYWDNFLTNKPDDLWTNSDITGFINERQPYSIPKCYFKDLLPYMAVSRGFASNMELGIYLPGISFIVQSLAKNNIIDIDLPNNDTKFLMSLVPPYEPLSFIVEGDSGSPHLDTYEACIMNNSYRFFSNLFTSKGSDPNSYYSEAGFIFNDGTPSNFARPAWANANMVNFPLTYENIVTKLDSLVDQIPQGSIKNNCKNFYSSFNNFRFFVRFKIISLPLNKQTFTHLYNQKGVKQSEPYDKCDFTNLIVPDIENNFIGIGNVVPPSDQRYQILKNTYYNTDYEFWCLPLPTAIESSQFGFSPLGYFFYNCNNITKHLDMMGVTIPSDFISFTRDELFTPINLLPYFAYNRFYHEEVADKQRQVNCPNWAAANGLISLYHNDAQVNEASLEKYQLLGWTLHFEDIPYNKQYQLNDVKITTYNPFSAAMLLSGMDINLLCVRYAFSDIGELQHQYEQQAMYNSFLQPVFQSYNGLLHLQYANFAPDYFNSSVMDPLAGAQDIQIPSTITQLQEKSKLQELLNQTAWTRNIKEFLQSQFDAFSKYTTIDDPVITGSCDVDVNISQVLQTSESATTPLGSRAGVGSAYGNGWLCDNEFHEFGYYMTVSYFVMNSVYINRLDKSVIAEDNYLELPFPQLANLGNEAIKQYEVKFGSTYANNRMTPSVNAPSFAPYVHGFAEVFNGQPSTGSQSLYVNEVNQPITNHAIENKPVPTFFSDQVNFGYIPRFSSYKFKMDQVHGDFLTSLKNWVPTRELQIMPLQTYTFISYECQAQLSNLMKNFVDKDQLTADSFLTNSVNIMSVRRCLPFVVNPSL